MCMVEVAFITWVSSQFANSDWRHNMYSYYGLRACTVICRTGGKVGSTHQIAGKPREPWYWYLWAVPVFLWAVMGLAINLSWSYAIRSWRS